MLFYINTQTLGVVFKILLIIGFAGVLIYLGVVFFFIILGLWVYRNSHTSGKEVYGVIDVGNLNRFTQYKILATTILILDILWFLVFSQYVKDVKDVTDSLLIIIGLIINIIFLISVWIMFSYYKKIVKPLIFYIPTKKKLKKEYKRRVLNWRIKMNSAIQIILCFQIFVVLMLGLCPILSLFVKQPEYISIVDSIFSKLSSYFSIVTLSSLFYYAGVYLVKDLDSIYWTYFEEDYKKWMKIVL